MNSGGALAGAIAFLTACSVALALGVQEPPATNLPTDPASLSGAPQRIVSTNLPTDEVLLALLAPSEILAVSTFADEPIVSNVRREASGVAHRVRGDSESIASLTPGVVFTYPFSRPEGQALLRSLSIPVVHVPFPTSFAGVRDNIRSLAQIVDREPEGEATLREMDARIDRVRERVRDTERPTVILYNPSGYTAGAGTLFDEIVELAGGANAVAQAGLQGHSRLTDELILTLDPDVVLVLEYRSDAESRDLVEPTTFAATPLYRDLQSVHTGRVHVMTGRFLLSTSHHAAGAVERVARHLHPDRFDS